MINDSGNYIQEKLRKSFHSAKTADEMLKVLNQMESYFEEEDLGMEFVTIANSTEIPLLKTQSRLAKRL